MLLALVLSALSIGDALIAGGLLCGTTSLRAVLAPGWGCSSGVLCSPAGARLLAHPGWRRARGRLQLAMSEESKEPASDTDAKEAADGRAEPLGGAEGEDDFSALDDTQRKFKAAGEWRGRGSPV